MDFLGISAIWINYIVIIIIIIIIIIMILQYYVRMQTTLTTCDAQRSLCGLKGTSLL